MNTANLQLEGLLMAVAAVIRGLRARGVVAGDEVEAILREAEAAVARDRLRPGALSPAHMDAVLFPLRFLRTANSLPDTTPPPTFSEIATEVGHTKRRPPG